MHGQGQLHGDPAPLILCRQVIAESIAITSFFFKGPDRHRYLETFRKKDRLNPIFNHHSKEVPETDDNQIDTSDSGPGFIIISGPLDHVKASSDICAP